MRPLLVSTSLFALSVVAFALGRMVAAPVAAEESAAPEVPPAAEAVALARPEAALEELLGCAVLGRVELGEVGAEVPLGELADLVVDSLTGRTRGCLVAAEGPEGPVLKRLDLRAEAWEPRTRQVRLGLGARAFASLPAFDALEPGAVLASELLETEPEQGSQLRVDLDQQRLTLVSADARTRPWVGTR